MALAAARGGCLSGEAIFIIINSGRVAFIRLHGAEQTRLFKLNRSLGQRVAQLQLQLCATGASVGCYQTMLSNIDIIFF